MVLIGFKQARWLVLVKFHGFSMFYNLGVWKKMRWTCIDKMAEWKSGECWTGVFNYKFFEEKYGMDACVDLMENSHKHSS